MFECFNSFLLALFIGILTFTLNGSTEETENYKRSKVLVFKTISLFLSEIHNYKHSRIYHLKKQGARGKLCHSCPMACSLYALYGQCSVARVRLKRQN
ncbi:hypothetical protein Patl1_02723 [Pistacia atlantica]|uniref:Uncharacterized protein n=1 Tax=Pistacia atlantica TaxID=434234 RepID=A0ACC1CBA4_9ROSI|nr:hypothetical protein Patl1_02723 [Pistacia atlantica]